MTEQGQGKVVQITHPNGQNVTFEIGEFNALWEYLRTHQDQITRGPMALQTAYSKLEALDPQRAGSAGSPGSSS